MHIKNQVLTGAQSQEDTADIRDVLGNRKRKWQRNEWVDYCKEVHVKKSVLCKNLVLHRHGFLSRTNHISVNTFGSFHYYFIPLSGFESKTSSCHDRFVEAQLYLTHSLLSVVFPWFFIAELLSLLINE